MLQYAFYAAMTVAVVFELSVIGRYWISRRRLDRDEVIVRSRKRSEELRSTMQELNKAQDAAFKELHDAHR